jgi:VanZ family protein
LNTLLQQRWLNSRLVPLLLYAVVLAGSSVPGKNIPKVFQLTPDKLIHFVEYSVVSFFFARVLVARPRIAARRVLWLCGTIGMAAAAADEVYQSLIPGRTPDFRDWLIDAVGVWAGAWLLLSWWSRLKSDNFSG